MIVFLYWYGFINERTIFKIIGKGARSVNSQIVKINDIIFQYEVDIESLNVSSHTPREFGQINLSNNTIITPKTKNENNIESLLQKILIKCLEFGTQRPARYECP